MFVSQVSAGEKGRPKAVAGLIEIAAGDKDARQRAVWLTEKGALSLEAGLPTGSGRKAQRRTAIGLTMAFPQLRHPPPRSPVAAQR